MCFLISYWISFFYHLSQSECSHFLQWKPDQAKNFRFIKHFYKNHWGWGMRCHLCYSAQKVISFKNSGTRTISIYVVRINTIGGMKSSSSKLENAKTKAAALKCLRFSTCFVCLYSDSVSMYMITYSFPQQDICSDQYFIVWLRCKKTHIIERSELVPGAWRSS